MSMAVEQLLSTQHLAILINFSNSDLNLGL